MGKRSYLASVLIILVLLTLSCGERRQASVEPTPPSYVTPRGQESTFELVTWNLKYFPQTSSTVEEVANIVEALDVDMYALQEINDTTAFRDLLKLLPEYDGRFSEDVYSWGYLKTGLLYKRSLISISQVHQIFQDDWYAFTRPPLVADATAQRNGERFDFVLIDLHLKAGSNAEDRDRRLQAVEKLKAYLDEQIASNDEKDYIVAGDWNDELDDPSGDNVFTDFLGDADDYRFLTATLVGKQQSASYPRYSTLIDHILISRDTFSEYDTGRTETLRLDEEVDDYDINISDHRPVMAVFPVFGG
jgi:endonuclease/exonuclease/phosphatase family metal-dependent hydrolase